MTTELLKQPQLDTKFVNDDEFKKEDIKQNKFNLSLFHIILIVNFIGIVYLLFIMFNYFTNRDGFFEDILQVQTYTQKKYSGNYQLVSSEILKDSQRLLNTSIKIFPTSINKANDAFAMEIYLGLHPQLSPCGVFSSVHEQFEVIKIDNKIVDKNIVHNYSDCNSLYKKIIPKTITLISK